MVLLEWPVLLCKLPDSERLRGHGFTHPGRPLGVCPERCDPVSDSGLTEIHVLGNLENAQPLCRNPLGYPELALGLKCPSLSVSYTHLTLPTNREV